LNRQVVRALSLATGASVFVLSPGKLGAVVLLSVLLSVLLGVCVMGAWDAWREAKRG
jgi:hypothetical protein